jgi:hypothetical protein
MRTVGVPLRISPPFSLRHPGNVYPIAAKMLQIYQKKKDQKKTAVNASFTYQAMKRSDMNQK